MQRLFQVPALICSCLLAFAAGMLAQIHAPPQLALAYGGHQTELTLSRIEKNAGFNPNHKTGIGKASVFAPSVDAVRQLRCLWRYPQLVPASGARGLK